MAIQSINPATGEVLASYPEASAREIDECLRQAEAAFRAWRRVDFPERSSRIRAVGDQLRKRKDRYARLMAQEMGKPLTQGLAEIEKCAATCDYYAEHAQQFLTRELIPNETAKTFVSFEPLGVILAIMPWNFPFWQVFRCAVPALMAGNAVLLKHAANVPGCAMAIEEVFGEADSPPGLFRTLLIESGSVAGLIEAPAVKAVSLTGSVSAGRAVAAVAGANLKKTVLELGGSDAYVILADCDMNRTVEACVAARLINGGQSCIAAKRFVVVEAVRERFEKLFVSRMGEARLGDPLMEGTAVGPLARRDLREQLHDQVERSIAEGAKLLLGGKIPPGAGWYYPPTVLACVRPGMTAFKEETFGPVAALIAAQDESEAIRIANDSAFGLGAAVFTQDRVRGERLAATELEAGLCFVNEYVRSDPRLPFGGIKDSGYGRELSAYGIREFVNVKTVWVHSSTAALHPPDLKRFETASQRFDQENGRDPNSELLDGVPQPRELVYARWLTDWVLRLCPEASEELRLAARCQHLCRWLVPRDSYPMTRVGYLQWREGLKRFHAQRAGEILKEIGYDQDFIGRVQALNLKKDFPQDPNSRVLENALCLVFLERQFADLARKTTDDKMIKVLQKAWKKMTPAAHAFAAKLAYTSQEKALLDQALSGSN